MCLILGAALVSAQSPGINQASSQAQQRQQYFRHGRVLPGQPAAAVRYRVHRQKLQLRDWDAAVSRLAGSSALPRVASGAIWTPLGPAPLASHATGLGVQDYGPVAAQAPPTCNVAPEPMQPTSTNRRRWS